MNIQPVFTRYDINRKIPFDRSSPIVVDHVEDYETRFIEVFVYESIYNKQVDLKGTTITARIVAALSTEKILLNDNVACTLNSIGNIIIPIDGAVIETLASALLIEIRITQGEQALVLPFPLYVQMRGSILDDAGIAPESQGTIPELLEAAQAALEAAEEALKSLGNYNNLQGKPQINGHTLSGNKTSDELGLQKKLTAGQNITLESDGTISAEGGVTSYNDLTDKPTVQVSNSQIVPLSGKLKFTSGFSLGNYLPGELIRVDLGEISRVKLDFWENYLFGNQVPSDEHFTAQYDFNNLRNPQVVGDIDYTAAGFYKCIGKCLVNTPQAFSSSIGDDSRVMIIHFNTIPVNEQSHYLLRVVYFQDSSTNKIRQFAQWIYYISQQDTTVHNVTDWCEIGSGSQIVSGVVNQNGTITFTDSDGNTFTTTGASVIGPQGNPGQDYVLTNQDKSDIADIVLGELPTTEGVLYGNANN